MSLAALNGASAAEFVAALDGVFEEAPWVAARVAAARPFASVAALHAGLMAAVRAAAEGERLALLRAHPELSAERLGVGLTAESAAEQGGLGMAQAEGAEALAGLNAAYRARFGFPFLICVRRHTPEDVLRQVRLRLSRSIEAEVAAAVDEVGQIARLRLGDRIEGAAVAGGRLSCHVLDTQRGRPAEGVAVVVMEERREVGRAVTDADGRVPGLLAGTLRRGQWMLTFEVGAYFAGAGVESFYEQIPVRFVVSEPEGHHHVPLLLAPFGYSTYRGS